MTLARSADVCLPRHLAKLLKATDRESIYSNELKEIVDPLRRLFPKDLGKLSEEKAFLLCSFSTIC